MFKAPKERPARKDLGPSNQKSMDVEATRGLSPYPPVPPVIVLRTFLLDLISTQWNLGELPNCDQQYKNHRIEWPKIQEITIQWHRGGQPKTNQLWTIVFVSHLGLRYIIFTNHTQLGSILWACQITPDWNRGSKIYKTCPTTFISLLHPVVI